MREFKIRPRGSRFFYRVLLFGSHSEMQDAVSRTRKSYGITSDPRKVDDASDAVTFSFKSTLKDGRTSPHIGDIFCNSVGLNAEIVSHECCHAAFNYARVLGFLKDVPDPSKMAEEKLSYAQGQFLQGFAVGLRRLKVW